MLRKARKTGVVNQGPLWADAVCINQMDNADKSVQVNMMDEVCNGTTRCIVWLGEEDDDAHTAVTFIRQVSKLATNTYDRFHKQTPWEFPEP